MSEITTLSNTFTTVIPAHFRRELQLKPGDHLVWVRHEKELVVRPRKRVTIDDITAMGAWETDGKEDIDRMYDEQW